MSAEKKIIWPRTPVALDIDCIRYPIWREAIIIIAKHNGWHEALDGTSGKGNAEVLLLIANTIPTQVQKGIEEMGWTEEMTAKQTVEYIAGLTMTKSATKADSGTQAVEDLLIMLWSELDKLDRSRCKSLQIYLCKLESL